MGVWVLLNKASLILGFVPPHKLDYFSHRQIQHVLHYAQQRGSIPKFAVSSVIFTFGAMWFAPVISRSAIWRNRLARAMAASGILTMMLAPFVTDWTRSFGYAFPLVIVGVALLPRGDDLRGTLSLAVCAAVLNFGVQSLPGDHAKLLFEAAFLLLEGMILFALSRQPDTDLVALGRPTGNLSSS